VRTGQGRGRSSGAALPATSPDVRDALGVDLGVSSPLFGGGSLQEEDQLATLTNYADAFSPDRYAGGGGYQ
jgi:hypothetical protein